MPIPNFNPLAYEGTNPATLQELIGGLKNTVMLTPDNAPIATPYVVGQNGSFDTIQSAINQAVKDGANLNNFKSVQLQAGIYTENIQLRPGILLCGLSLGSAFTTVIMGEISYSDVITPTGFPVLAILSNIQVFNPSGPCLTLTGGNGTIPCLGCFFVSTDASSSTVSINTTGTEMQVNGDLNVFLNLDSTLPTVTVGASSQIEISRSLIENSNVCVLGTDDGEVKFAQCNTGGIMRFEDTSNLNTEYSRYRSATDEVIQLVDAGTSANLLACYINSNGGPGDWITGLGTLNSSTTNTLIGNRLTIDAGISVNNFPTV